MKIEPQHIPVRDVVKDYKDSAELGVTAYGGKLDIRPKYQREFVYKPEQRNAVIRTAERGFPLNVMYWVVRDDGGYEVLDGQQRTISLAQYIHSEFSLDDRFFHNLTVEEQDKILDYKLMIYFCEGTDKERLDWFKTINIAGEKLSDQELRNAVYTGPWLSNAKLIFSKTGCAAYGLANDGGALISAELNRQGYLETALSWINHGEPADYMARHQLDPDADELWKYFQNVIAWVRQSFINYRREMKGVAWGPLYNQFKDATLDPKMLEIEIKKLMQDEDVTKKAGIYSYVLTRKESYLSIRAFTDRMKREAYERQEGNCIARNATCGNAHFDIGDMEADHITPWVEGGKTTTENCQMLCRDDNRRKGKI